MTTRQVVLTGLIAGTTLGGSSARADLVGLCSERFVGEGWIEHGYAGLTTYRVYAEFDGLADDGVLEVFGLPGLPLTMSSSDGVFHNAPAGLDGLTAPPDLRAAGVWENQWDTYVTINATDASGDATDTSPDFATETNDLTTDFTLGNGGWFVTPDDGQSMARDGRVLVGQFTVEAGATISGTLHLLLRDGSSQQDPPTEVVACKSTCPEDIDGSGDVGMGDLLAILSAWGNEGGPEDVDESGVVGFGDVLVILRLWGPCV